MKDMNAEDLRAYNRNRQREYREKQKKKSEEEKKKSEEKKKKSEMNKQYYAVCKKKQEATVLWDKTNDPATPKPVDTPKHEPLPLARQAMDYFDKSPDPFHAVQSSIDMLAQQAGFEELQDAEPYAGKIQPGMISVAQSRYLWHFSSHMFKHFFPNERRKILLYTQ